ncbi:magnesium transporter [Reinekea forsetii]|uniref:Magnesium transporter MgtE n=1 Tax=Reinekea forsetii TaxID=1336806 RepID=A0A2K8KS10_9GAMM|nr:magnesium transporter [Reinekea forsetii]ATX77520.1 Mg/Co/Ni transporter MgtE / CBS domain protein [Reinekea forsetii]MDO7640703.1 magnesium transporter [Reinekea forsetii]
MPASLTDGQLNSHKQQLGAALEKADLDLVSILINADIAVGDIAHLLETTPHKHRLTLWDFVADALQGEVLTHLNEDIQQSFLARMSAEEIVETTHDIDNDDLADLLQQMPEGRSSRVLQLLAPEERSQVEGLLAYPEDTAGGLMTTDMVTVRGDVTVAAVLRYLRKISLPDALDRLWVTNRQFHYQGSLALTVLLTAKPSSLVSDIMNTDIKGIRAGEDEEQVARLFERQDLVSAPVINDDGIVIGRITIDDVVDVISDSAAHNMMSMAGLDEENDTYSPIVKSSQDRAVWLGINMATAFIAALVMSQFEASIAQIVALAVLSPVVASMGGIAGSQTLTLMIRGMATGHIGQSNLTWLVLRELGVGLINGSLWAIVIGVITFFWYHQVSLSLVIAAAILVNICIAVLSGTVLPFFLKAANIDPALSGSVILTTLTDVFGFLTFLGLATLFLL